ncbi:Uncharacterised protein [Lysinibacillus sphaericus]|uniref:Uncharacterized protein n=1 Tax=Lysinibacillus sphaericus TaxID=1421 RepID=A0A2S0JV86_LYSSH|nr:hypothetical protein LS41612_01485 [Lysinibacillus sphaericus]GEC83836.1 hypothetical protein LSP03_35790 [Lysinibacillus sphaericus]SUV19654.1 Uncharacterised protein [Lysinibacillus sphaericus]
MSCPQGWNKVGECYGDAFCNHNDGCGFLWLEKSYQQHIYAKCQNGSKTDCYYSSTTTLRCC